MAFTPGDDESQRHGHKFKSVQFHRREQAPSKSYLCVKNFDGRLNGVLKTDEGRVSN